jgi:hypothetical protein
LTAAWLDFVDVSVEVSPDLRDGYGAFSIRLVRDAPLPKGLRHGAYVGRFRVEGDLIVTGMRIAIQEAA